MAIGAGHSLSSAFVRFLVTCCVVSICQKKISFLYVQTEKWLASGVVGGYGLSMAKRYTAEERQALIDKVFIALEDNSTVGACRLVGVPESTFLDWIRSNDDLSAKYAHARTLYPEKLVQRILTLARETVGKDERGKTDTGRVQQIRVEIDALKWILSKIMPKRYGDRLIMAGDDEQPLVVGKVECVIVDKRIDKDG